MNIKKISKQKILEAANNLGSLTKEKAAKIGNITKKAAITVADNVKEGSEQLGEKLGQLKYENDKRKFCPIYKEDVLDSSFVLPSLIRIVEYDKRKENKACEGAIGFLTGKEVKILNIYREFIDLLNINFYPLVEETIYHVDPCFDKNYIKLDEYFVYLKKVRVDELIEIAQNLGAKHVEIVLKVTRKSMNNHKRTVNARSLVVNGEVTELKSNREVINIDVAAKIDFLGNEMPVKPKVRYFKNESDINSLIKMRLNSNENKLLSKTYSFQYGNSSGIDTNYAQKIDESLTDANIKINHSILNESLTENNTILEYSISF